MGLLNCFIFFLFFIGYLGFIGHEMDFETNLYFSPHRSGLTLRKFCVPLHVYTIKQSYIIKKMKNSKCQTYPPKNQKNILSVYFVFQGILNNF